MTEMLNLTLGNLMNTQGTTRSNMAYQIIVPNSMNLHLVTAHTCTLYCYCWNFYKPQQWHGEVLFLSPNTQDQIGTDFMPISALSESALTYLHHFHFPPSGIFLATSTLCSLGGLLVFDLVWWFIEGLVDFGDLVPCVLVHFVFIVRSFAQSLDILGTIPPVSCLLFLQCLVLGPRFSVDAGTFCIFVWIYVL